VILITSFLSDARPEGVLNPLGLIRAQEKKIMDSLTIAVAAAQIRSDVA